MKNKKPNKIFIVSVAVFFLLAGALSYYLYNYVRPGKIMICENISSGFEEQNKTLNVSIKKDNSQAYRLIIEEYLPKGKKRIIADREGFTGAILQIQSLVMDIAELDLGQNCYIRDKHISLYLRIFSPFFEKKYLDVSMIGKVPTYYRRDDISDFIQKNTWKKIWAYALNPLNKKTISVYNIILDIENISRYTPREYIIFLDNDGRMDIKHPYQSNISPARQR
jgi:hypothetical protein